MKGKIFNIQRFCVHDGPGIRTTVFFKGCPLRCRWCHNPESYSLNTDIMYSPEKCIGCGACVEVCEYKAHGLKEGIHIFNRDSCIKCGICSKYCYSGAVRNVGETITDDEVISKVIRDKEFYADNGGMTLSGGEPMLQPEFALSLCKKAKENDINVCIETSGYCDFEHFEKIIPYTDLFLFDIKVCDNELHKKYTGVSNERILKNLFLLDDNGAKTVIRCPVIPGVNMNDRHFEALVEIINKLKFVVEINLEPYHPIGINKFHNLGINGFYDNELFTEKEELSEFAEKIFDKTGVTVKIM